MTMINKITPTSMRDQYDHQYNVFCRKNHDYGNSFEKSLDTFGLVAGIVRMNDKFERLVSLNDPSKDAQIASESLVDTLEDLSNYAAMAACWLKGKKADDWKTERSKELEKFGDELFKGGITGRRDGKTRITRESISKAIDERINKAATIIVKPEKIPQPKQFILDVTKDIVATVRMKEKKNELLVYMDISDDAARIAKCAIFNDVSQLDVMEIVNDKCVQNKLSLELIGFIEGVILRHIYYMKKSRDLDTSKSNASKTVKKPEFSGINLFGPEKLELNLEVDQDKLFEISNALHPSTLPKSVKVNYGHNAVYEFPDGIDTIASYLQQLSHEEAKKENDRVMLDMMLSRIEKGEVVRIVANGDGSFTTYFEKTDCPFDKIVDKEGESIFFEKEGLDDDNE